MARRILITGASGLIGRHVVPLFADDDVHVASRSGERGVNLLDLSAVDALLDRVRPTHLLHLAWTTEHGQFWSDPANLDWQAATVHLARRFIEFGGQRFVGAGTCAEYAWDSPQPMNEAVPCAPRTLYGKAKNITRQRVDALCADAGVSFAWGRVFFLYGPGEAPARFVPSIALPLLRGQPARCNAPGLRRDFMHAVDVAGAFTAILNSSVLGAINVASGDAQTLGDVARIIARSCNANDALSFGDTGPTSDNPAVLAADITRLRNEVGFQPHFDLERGLTDMIHSLRI